MLLATSVLRVHDVHMTQTLSLDNIVRQRAAKAHPLYYLARTQQAFGPNQ
jgi:hypothetical protein